MVKKMTLAPTPPEPHFKLLRRVESSLARHQPWWILMIMFLILALGLLVRLEDLRSWRRTPGRAFISGEILLTSRDGYRYLAMAREMSRGRYARVDDMRGVPDGVRRPYPPPLLSLLATALSSLSGASLNWIGALTPAFLGVLLAGPLFGLGRIYGGAAMGLGAALLGLLSPAYALRSGLGFFDHDCLIVTLASATAFFSLRLGLEKRRRRYGWAGAGVAAYVLLLWSWDEAPLAASAVALLPLFLSLAFFYRPPWKEGLIFAAGLSLCLALILTWQAEHSPVSLIGALKGQLTYISKARLASEPNVGLSVAELQRPTFSQIIHAATGHVLTFALSWLGLALCWRRHGKKCLVLLALLGLAGMGLMAKRFLIFSAPLTALGLGFLIAEVWSWKKRLAPAAAAAPLLALALAYPTLSRDIAHTAWPPLPAQVAAGLEAASKKTPAEAVIWAWWDTGFAINYFARRGSVNDGSGQVQTGLRTVFNGLPLAVSDEKLAANFMQFFVARGMKGLQGLFEALGNDRAVGVSLAKKVLSAGPAKAEAILASAGLKGLDPPAEAGSWLNFFFPLNPRPVYLFLDVNLAPTAFWWHWLATWDLAAKRGVHALYQPYVGLSIEATRITDNQGMEVDLTTGLLRQGRKLMPLKRVSIREKKRWRSKGFDHQRGTVFEVFGPARLGVLMDAGVAGSVFNKLFLRHRPETNHFKPVFLNSPWCQLWEVQADRPAHQPPSSPGRPSSLVLSP